MTVQLVNDKREFIGLSTDTKPTMAPHTHGARLKETDTGLVWIWDGASWVEDLELIHALTEVLG